jgi:hypothetical protein
MDNLEASPAPRSALATRVIRVISTASLLALLAPALIGPGCGSDTLAECMNVCEAGTKCPGGTLGDCPSYCSATNTAANAAGCSSEFSDAVSCAAGAASACSATSPCTAEDASLSACAGAYCTENPTSAACSVNPNGGGSGGGTTG